MYSLIMFNNTIKMKISNIVVLIDFPCMPNCLFLGEHFVSFRSKYPPPFLAPLSYLPKLPTKNKNFRAKSLKSVALMQEMQICTRRGGYCAFNFYCF